MRIIINIPDNMTAMCRWHKEGICELTNIEVGILVEAVINGTPLPKGHWIDINGDKSLWKCSHCGQHSCCNGNFCIDCGADMREADKEET